MEIEKSHFEEITDLPKFPNLLKHLTPEMIKCLDRYGQIGLTTIPGFERDYTLATGSLLKDWSNKKTIKENGVIKIEVPNKKIRLHEKDFTVLCDIFKGTIFEEIYNVLNERYILGRIRIFKSEPKTCLTWHVDEGMPRLHYPIKTQEGCFMVIEDEVKHLELDKWWMTDTTKHHTAFNSSRETRLHLVAVIGGIR